MMNDIPPCPKPRSATEGWASTPTAPRVANSRWHGHADATAVAGRARPLRSRTCAPVSGSWIASTGFVRMSSSTPTSTTSEPSSANHGMTVWPAPTPPSSCAA